MGSGGVCEAGDKRVARKQDSQGSRNQEKLRQVSQHCRTFCNKNRTNRQEELRKRWELGVKGMGSRRFRVWRSFLKLETM